MKNIKQVQNKLKKINKKLYIVGGFCREKILWNELSWDIDLVTDATPLEMNQVLKVVWEVGKKYWTCIISEGSDVFELTTFRKDIWSINYRKPAEVEFTDSLEEDVKRRDFTCNAIYFDLETEKYIDPENGIDDIKNWIIRFVWNIKDRIDEDVLRILRFIRFKNKYWFKVADEKYFKVLKENIKILKNLPIERIRKELDKILLDSSNVQAFEDLKQIWFLDLFIPELSCLEKYAWNKYHLEWNVRIHTMMGLKEMNTIVKRENIVAYEQKLTLYRAILLHDIWKAVTFTVSPDGESHYYNHENIWAGIFKNQLVKRLNFSNNLEKEIYFLITEHLRLFHIPEMRAFKARKLMMRSSFNLLLLLWEADNKWRIPQKLESFNEILKIYSDFKLILKTKVFLTGDDIMKKYPELKWREIGDKMKQLNDQILVID